TLDLRGDGLHAFVAGIAPLDPIGGRAGVEQRQHAGRRNGEKQLLGVHGGDPSESQPRSAQEGSAGERLNWFIAEVMPSASRQVRACSARLVRSSTNAASSAEKLESTQLATSPWTGRPMPTRTRAKPGVPRCLMMSRRPL